MATISRVSAKLIRHNESIGLIRKPGRNDSGYRLFNDNDVYTLRFIKRARIPGFPLEKIGYLLGFWLIRRHAGLDVKRLAADHLKELEKNHAGMKDINKKVLTFLYRRLP